MGQIIPLRIRREPSVPPSHPVPERAAAILIFTGIRYERHEAASVRPPAAPRKPRRTRRASET